jgi:hypothetical protein
MMLRRDSELTNAEIVELIAKKLETGSGNVYNSCLIYSFNSAQRYIFKSNQSEIISVVLWIYWSKGP